MTRSSSVFSRLFQKLISSSSIQSMTRQTYVVIIILMAIPPFIGLTSTWAQTIRYDRIITNVNKTKTLNQIVEADISNEIWDIVAGNKDFTEGRQYEIIDSINFELDAIYQGTALVENRQMLEVAGRAVDTLTKYVDMLGVQMKQNFLVQENEKVLEEIRGVAELVSDILQDFIVLEIESAADANEGIKRMVFVLSLSQLFIIAFVLTFAVLAQKKVSERINTPITELEKLSNQIAAGNLLARADLPGVKELDNLTRNLNIMAQKIEDLLAAHIQEQKNLQKSEMKALQAQITPHFLYNTLDSIIWLAEGRKYDQVIEVTRNFSSFFRTSLNRGKEWMTVGEELEHIRNYLTIQKVRYRDILDFSITCGEGMEDRSMLKLLLQPLVENALYHGIKNKRGGGKIEVRAWSEEGFLCFRVCDDGIGMEEDRLTEIRRHIEEGLGDANSHDFYGLFNVNKRLMLYYSSDTRLEIESEYGKGSSVSFRLPEISNV